MFGTECEGVSSFDRIRHRDHDDCVFLYAFDLIELDGDDLRRDPLVVRKATLTSVLAKGAPGIRFNEHMAFDDGETVFRHACRPVLKVSCRSGRTRPIVRVDRQTGSSSRTPVHRR